jgi:hypothetical protein
MGSLLDSQKPLFIRTNSQSLYYLTTMCGRRGFRGCVLARAANIFPPEEAVFFWWGGWQTRQTRKPGVAF